MTEFRVEHDSMGEVQLPKMAYYGAQTQRAVGNFPISRRPIAPELIHALGLVKLCAAKANAKLGRLTKGRAPLGEKELEALYQAAQEVADGKLDAEFPIDVYQTGSGTSSNMNANEVISNRALEIAGYDRFDQNKKIHPNDHVNCGQSTNDMFPTSIHVAVAVGIQNRLIPALEKCAAILKAKAEEWKDVIKIGRTHLADATPMTLGQEFGGFARQFELAIERAKLAVAEICELPCGGTAVGSGINCDPKFGSEVAAMLAEKTGVPFKEAQNHFEANAQRDGLVACHAMLKAVATTMSDVANNIRWLGSGPRCGYYEVVLKDLQPGSSIMPGKVNPVICESVMQLGAKVVGNDMTISLSGVSGGQFQLNILMPVMADVALDSVRILSGGAEVFADKCLEGLTANKEKCAAAVEQSLSIVTGLNPYIGYEKAAALAKKAFKSGKTIRQLCEEEEVLPKDQLAEGLDVMRMTRPLDK
ncbi:MAG: class II fumarate hydratase [Thermoguttaceae bacterium]|nr:class II fumarate hydratase [Thermoguttaceae bacterium]